MVRTFFTSDPHFGHEKVAAIRGFQNGLDHDSWIFENVHKRVKPDDILWILGDLSAGGAKATRYALAWIDEMPGRKRLIAGNHDPIHPMNRNAHKWAAEFAEVFEFVAPFARVSLNGLRVMLSHFPYEADRDVMRYGQYRLRNQGMHLLHGHLHSPDVRTSPRECHVGVDAWGLAPVTSDEILDAMGWRAAKAPTDS